MKTHYIGKSDIKQKVQEKYIPKSILLAEIERLYKAHSGKYGCDEVALNLEYLEDFIDTIEVKEMD